MTERGIIFSAPMVLAILAGKKTQTRRIVDLPFSRGVLSADGWRPFDPESADDRGGMLACGPYSGGHLYVREAWRTCKSFDDRTATQLAAECLEAGFDAPWAPLVYLADGKHVNWDDSVFRGNPPGRYRHARFMPRWASRITLEITDVRVERLQEISEADAIVEGVDTRCLAEPDESPECSVGWRNPDGFARDNFRALWDSINGEREGASWEENPWVWAITFKRVEVQP